VVGRIGDEGSGGKVSAGDGRKKSRGEEWSGVEWGGVERLVSGIYGI
jgi:hypothetical protein